MRGPLCRIRSRQAIVPRSLDPDPPPDVNTAATAHPHAAALGQGPARLLAPCDAADLEANPLQLAVELLDEPLLLLDGLLDALDADERLAHRLGQAQRGQCAAPRRAVGRPDAGHGLAGAR